MSLRTRISEKFQHIARLSRVHIALSRAAATSSTRSVNPTNPLSWQFCGFSQNQEDGIIDFLCARIILPNRYFIEIGAGNGYENNTTWLAIAKRYSGLMVEGGATASAECTKLLNEFVLGVKAVNLFVEPETAKELAALSLYPDPDFMSVDIDGNDYHVMKALVEAGLRPKVVAVEYNSAYGPEKSATIAYRPSFNYLRFHESGVYYGVSVGGWRTFFDALGYRFVTVESNGVNAFFIDPRAFDPAFVANIEGLRFQENFYQRAKFRNQWEAQFEIIKGMAFYEIR